MAYLTLTAPSIYFFLRPNWNKDYKWGRSWNTRMIKSRQGHEQRGKMKALVERKLSFYVAAMGFAETSRIRRTLFRNKRSVWGCPIWQYESFLVNEASAGTNELMINGMPNLREIKAGSYLMIGATLDSYEVVIVESVSNNMITLTDNLSLTWPSGKVVYPLLRSTITNVSKMAPIDPEHFTFSIEFTESFRAS